VKALAVLVLALAVIAGAFCWRDADGQSLLPGAVISVAPSLSSAGNALPPASAVVPAKIISFQKMTPFAMRLSSIQGSDADAPQNVHGRSHKLQVNRPHAGSITTKMIGLQSVRDRTNQQFVGKAVGSCLLTIYEKATITRFHNIACPPPAGFSFLNAIPKSFDGGHVAVITMPGRGANATPLRIVLSAPAAGVLRPGTVWDGTL
jgi:hypothetical protein